MVATSECADAANGGTYVENPADALGGAFLLAAVVLLLAGCGVTDTVVIATGGNYHPFNFVNDQGEIDGLERALGYDLCRRAGLKCQWILNEGETMIPHLLDGEFDVIFAGMSITEQRERLIDFTQAYLRPRHRCTWSGRERAPPPSVAGSGFRPTPYFPTTYRNRAYRSCP